MAQSLAEQKTIAANEPPPFCSNAWTRPDDGALVVCGFQHPPGQWCPAVDAARVSGALAEADRIASALVARLSGFSAKSAKDPNEVLASAESQELRARIGDASEAARVLNITKAALWGRRKRDQLPPGSVIETGRRVQFRIDRLLACSPKKSRKRAR